MKKELRARLRKMLASLPPEAIKERSAVVAANLIAQPEYKRAEIVMLFLSLPTEIDTTPIALRSWKDRKRVVAPQVSWEQRRMIPIEIRSLTDGLTASPLGILEPMSGVPIPVADIDLIIVPGLGFDPFGNRLGRGRGFFDRFLAHKDRKGIACAVAFEEQFVPQVPVGPHDIAVDMLVTDQSVRRFGR